MTIIAGFGEILLRLKSPGHERFLQSAAFEASFGGAELNVLASLSLLGHQTRLMTVLPSNPLGAAALQAVHRYGINSRDICHGPGRMGVYFLEKGAGHRSAQIVYDREHSAFSNLKSGAFSRKNMLENVSWLHLTGITPALGPGPAAEALTLARLAHASGIPVSLDLNYREHLWTASGQSPKAVMTPFLEHVSVLVAGPDDCSTCFGIESAHNSGEEKAFLQASDQILSRYGNIHTMVSTFRQAPNADRSIISAMASHSSGPVKASPVEISSIVDRIGAGDAFVAGLIHGLISEWTLQKAVDFGIAAEAVKHTISGDINLATLEEIEAVMNGSNGGRVRR